MDCANLYVRGDQDTNEQQNEDIWDDELLIKAYDRAVNSAKAKIVKRMGIEGGNHPDHLTNVISNKSQSNWTTKWKVGDYCRVSYSVDNVEYEATIVKFVSNRKCVVKYCGYNNEELVDVRDLKASYGEEVRVQQMQESTVDGNCSSNQQRNEDKVEKLSTSNNENQSNSIPHVPPFNGIPPFPPPLPPGFLENLKSQDESDALSAMLMSWYMSGYHTGYFQCMKQMGKQKK